jgi:hypothetical protein
MTITTTSLSPRRSVGGSPAKGKRLYTSYAGLEPFFVFTEPAKHTFFVQKSKYGGKSQEDAEIFELFKPFKNRVKYEKAWLTHHAALFYVDAGKYVFVGVNHSAFATPDNDLIFSLYCPVAKIQKLDVPYCFAIGKANTYLLMEDVFISNADMKTLKLAPGPELYKEYFTKDPASKAMFKRYAATTTKGVSVSNLVHRKC